MLPPEAIEKLKQIYQAEFRQELSDKEALEMAHNLLSLFSILLRPLPEDKQEPKKEGKSRRQLSLF